MVLISHNQSWVRFMVSECKGPTDTSFRLFIVYFKEEMERVVPFHIHEYCYGRVLVVGNVCLFFS